MWKTSAQFDGRRGQTVYIALRTCIAACSFRGGNLHESKFPHIWKESPQMHEVRSIAALVQISGVDAPTRDS